MIFQLIKAPLFINCQVAQLMLVAPLWNIWLDIQHHLPPSLPPCLSLHKPQRGLSWTSYHDLGCSYLHTVGNSNRVKSSFFCGVWMLKIFAKCIIIPNKYCIMADILSWNLKYNIFVIFLMSRAIWYFLTTVYYQYCKNNSLWTETDIRENNNNF